MNKKLGRGLEALMSAGVPEASQVDSDVVTVAISRVHPNPGQPRKEFDPVKLAELAESISTHGILQPILVKPGDSRGDYEIIAGERRYRAAQIARVESVRCIVMTNVDGRKQLELSLIENLHRDDLNPIEKAVAYRELIEEFNLTQEEVGVRLGQDRSTVANMLRLLELPHDVQDFVSRGTLSMGHARAILGLPTHAQQRSLANRVIKNGLSVRDVEKIVASISKTATQEKANTGRGSPKSPHIADFEEQVMRKTGCKSVIIMNGEKSGKLIIDFADNDDFERILSALGIPMIA